MEKFSSKKTQLKTDLRKDYTKSATEYLAKIKITPSERDVYITAYNRTSGQRQVSLPRIFVKLIIEEGLTLEQVMPYIKTKYKALEKAQAQAKAQKAKALAEEKALAEAIAEVEAQKALVEAQKARFNPILGQVKKRGEQKTQFKSTLSENILKKSAKVKLQQELLNTIPIIPTYVAPEILERNRKSKARKNAREKQREKRRIKALNKLKVKKTNDTSFYLKTPVGTQKIRGNQLYLPNLELLFIEDNLEELFDLTKNVHKNLPRGFKFSIGLVGNQYKGDTLIKTNDRFLRTNINDNLLQAFQDGVINSKNINLPSDYYWVITKIEINYEGDQGGSSHHYKKVKNVSELVKYEVYSPTTTKNCGKMVLAHYNIECENGFISMEMMKAKLLSKDHAKHLNVYKFFEGFSTEDNEFLLLKDHHWLRCVTKELNKSLKKQVKMDKLAKYGNPDPNMYHDLVIVWDIEASPVDKKQIPLVIGYCSNEDNFDYYYGDDCVKNFVEIQS